MAEVIIPPGFGQASFSITAQGGRPAAVVIGFAGNGGTAQDTADTLSFIWSTTILESMASALAYNGCRTVQGNDGPPLVAESVEGAGFGGNSGQPVIANTSVLVKKGTGLAGRHYQGRMFLPGATEGQTDDGTTLTTDGVTGWTSSTTAFLEALQTSLDFEGMVILHGPIPGSDQLAPTPVTELVVQGRFATQRRRLRK